MENGSGDAEPEVVRFSGACYKHFRTLAQAEAFIADWKEMYACVVKDMIKVKGTPVALSLKAEGSDEEDDLTDGLSRIGIS